MNGKHNNNNPLAIFFILPLFGWLAWEMEYIHEYICFIIEVLYLSLSIFVWIFFLIMQSTYKGEAKYPNNILSSKLWWAFRGVHREQSPLNRKMIATNSFPHNNLCSSIYAKYRFICIFEGYSITINYI